MKKGKKVLAIRRSLFLYLSNGDSWIGKVIITKDNSTILSRGNVYKMLTNYIHIGFNIESFVHIIVIIIGFLCLIFFLRLDKKRYGLLFILSALAGNIFCYMFVKLNFYSFPYLLFPTITDMPIVVITLSFPIIVFLSSVRYSPENLWKVPSHWTVIHIGMFFETWALANTKLIRYNFNSGFLGFLYMVVETDFFNF